MSISMDEAIKLRDHVRLTWRAKCTSWYVFDDVFNKTGNYMRVIDKTFHTPEAAAYIYLTSVRAFLRTVEAAAKTVESPNLIKCTENLNEQFPGCRNARDVIEHFDEYAVGKGKLQKNGTNISGPKFSIYNDEKSETYISIFNFDPIPICKLALWADWLFGRAEEVLHGVIEPDEEYKGLWPQYDFVAPENWRER